MVNSNPVYHHRPHRHRLRLLRAIMQMNYHPRNLNGI